MKINITKKYIYKIVREEVATALNEINMRPRLRVNTNATGSCCDKLKPRLRSLQLQMNWYSQQIARINQRLQEMEGEE